MNPTAFRETILEYVARSGERKEHSFSVRLLDGRALPGRINPIAGGGTVIAFTTTFAESIPPLLPVHRTPSETGLPERKAAKDPLLFKIEA